VESAVAAPGSAGSGNVPASAERKVRGEGPARPARRL